MKTLAGEFSSFLAFSFQLPLCCSLTIVRDFAVWLFLSPCLVCTPHPLFVKITGFPLSGKMVMVCFDSDTIRVSFFAKVLSYLDPLVLSRSSTVVSTSGLKSSSSIGRLGPLSEMKSFTIGDFAVLG